MQIQIESTTLILNLGRLRGEYHMPLQQVDAWNLWYQPLGHRFLASHIGGRTHCVNLPRRVPEAWQALLANLPRLLERSPAPSCWGWS